MPQTDHSRRRGTRAKARSSLQDKYASRKKNQRSSSSPFLNDEWKSTTVFVLEAKDSSDPSCSSNSSCSSIWGVPSPALRQRARWTRPDLSNISAEENGVVSTTHQEGTNANDAKTIDADESHANSELKNSVEGDRIDNDSDDYDDEVYYSAVDDAMDGVTLKADVFPEYSEGSISDPDQINTDDGKGSYCWGWPSPVPSLHEGSLQASTSSKSRGSRASEHVSTPARNTQGKGDCAERPDPNAFGEDERDTLSSQHLEHERILLPHLSSSLKQPPLPLRGFKQLLGRRIEFVRVRSITGGNGTAKLEVVRSISRSNDGLGFKKNSVWVLKKFKTRDVGLSDSIRALTQLKRECNVYARIAEAPKEGKVGFDFIMTLEATMTFSKEHCLILPSMTTDLALLIDSFGGQVMPKQDIRRIIAQMGVGIGTLHSIGIIHGDIKPANIFIDAGGNVKIGDFGLSYLTQELETLDRDRLYTAKEIGTKGYMAPEKVEGKGYSYPVDYWSLGCIFCEMVGVDGQILNTFEESKDIEQWAKNSSDVVARKLFFRDQGLDSETLSLLCGLLDPSSQSRMGIADLIVHPYFKIDENCSEFAGMRERALAGWETVPVKTPKEKISVRSIYISEPADETLYRWINPYSAYVPQSHNLV